MKYTCALLMTLFAATAQAQLIVPKGSKATLKVTYEFKSEGKAVSPAKDVKSQWRAHRVVEMTANYVAEAPQPFSALRKDDHKNKQDLAGLQSKVDAVHKTLQPTMDDVMKMVEKCGEDEDCMARAVAAYADQMDLDTVKTGKEQAMAATQAATATRFQMWTLTSQQGTYRIDEEMTRQVYELTCTDTQVCKRVETRKGGGVIAPPEGNPAGSGVSYLEVDSVNKDLMGLLPQPLSLLGYTRTVSTSIPDESGGTTKEVMSSWLTKASQPDAVAIPAGFKSVPGRQSYKIAGDEEEGGTLTVSWSFTRL